MRFFSKGKVSQKDPVQTNSFVVLIDQLRQGVLTEEAARFNAHLRETAWTTEMEFLGEFELAMKNTRQSARLYGSEKKKAEFKSAARVVKRTWPLIFY